MDTVAKRVAHAMKVRGLGCNELDRRLGRSEGYTSRMISDNRLPRADTLRSMAHALEVAPAWLLEGAGSMDSAHGSPEMQPVPLRSRARYPNLERSIAYWEAQRRWGPATLTAARDMQLDADEDPPPQWWTEQLDRFEAAIQAAVIHRIGEPIPGDPILEARAKRKVSRR